MCGYLTVIGEDRTTFEEEMSSPAEKKRLVDRGVGSWLMLVRTPIDNKYARISVVNIYFLAT